MENEKFVDDFLTMEYWLNDNIPLAGQVYKQFVEDCFHNNLLIQNKMHLGPYRVDLRNITCPVLSIVADQDHLVPPSSSRALKPLVGTRDYSEIAFPGGHIGIYVSGRSQRDVPPAIHAWLAKRSG